MPVTPTYPGVYIEELTSGVRPVIGVATSITAFVGYAPRGPENTAVRISNFGEYERRFGGLDSESELGFAVQQFFRNGGTEALIVRAPKSDANTAGVTLLDSATTNPAPKKALVLTASSSGAWGNSIVVDVDYDAAPDTKSFNVTITDLGTGTTERFTGLSSDSGSPRYAVTVLNDGDRGSALVKAAPGEANAGRPVAAGTEGTDLATLTADVQKNYRLTIRPDAPTKPDPNDATKTVPSLAAVEVSVLEKGERLPSSTAGLAALLQRKINATLGSTNGMAGIQVRVVPSGSGLGLRIYGDTDPAVAPKSADAGFIVGSVTTAGEVVDAAEFLKLKGSTANVGRYTAAGTKRLAQGDVVVGTQGTTLPGTSGLIGSEGSFTGIYALLKTDLFNLLCIPDATRAKQGDPKSVDANLNPDAVWAAAYELCVRRRAMLLVDPPPGVDEPDRALDWINQLGTKGPNAVAHFPRIRIPDATDGFQPRTVAPSATLAGLYARTDVDRGVWKAPAGTDARLRGVTRLLYGLTDAENGVLNPLGLNCLRTFPVIGTVNWGARTTDGADIMASQWKYTPVRRLALFIEESVFRGTQWVVFEPNDEPLWGQIRLNLTSFMQDLFRKGAFAGKTPREAYLVKCDSQTTTRDDVDRGVVNVVVGFAPLKPAEFVIIRIQQLAGQSPS